MKLEMPHKRDRGQVGIGTLIVFIAMVLVAAIAAGVLINTAGFLQSQSQETGESSSEQVTNRLTVVSSVGDAIDNDEVEQVNVTVKQAPGAANIDLSATTVQWTDDSGAYDLTYMKNPTSSSLSGSNFNVTAVQENGDDTSLSPPNPVLNDPSDRAKLFFDLDLFRNGGGLPEGSSAELQINTQSGGNTNLILNVPQTLSGTSAVNL